MPRCNLTLKQKAQLIELSKELSTGQLAKKFRVHTTTVTRTIRKKDRILQQASRVNPNFKTVQTNLRSEEHDALMLDYIKGQQDANRPISVSDICDKAVEFAEALGREIKSQRAWWRRFRVRCNVVKSKLARDEKQPKSVKNKRKTKASTIIASATATTTKGSIKSENNHDEGEQVDIEVQEVVELLKDNVREPETNPDRSSENHLVEQVHPDDELTEPISATIVTSDHLKFETSEHGVRINDGNIISSGCDNGVGFIETNEDLITAETSELQPALEEVMTEESSKNGTAVAPSSKRARKASLTTNTKTSKSKTTKASSKKTDDPPVIIDKNFTFKVKETPGKGASSRGLDVPPKA